MSVRPTAVAGMFYPDDPDELRDALRDAFARAVPPPAGAPVPKALIAPHAGYPYSGPIAASAYLRVAPAHATVRRVVVLGPSHRVYLDGLAVPDADAFATPLGEIPIDDDLRQRALAVPGVIAHDGPHRLEHSLEVQLPFLQTVLDEFTLLPIVVGDTSSARVADVLEAVWGGDETLVVVSTDLSHYHPYGEATELDAATAAAIAAGNERVIGDSMACGARPLRGLLRLAAGHDLTVDQIDLRNSGDTAGDRHRVVGYGAFAIR